MENDKLVEKIKGYMKEFHVSGVAVGKWHEDETFTEGLGVTNVDHPISARARFTMASTGRITSSGWRTRTRAI